MPKFLSELEPVRHKDGRYLVECACGWLGKRRVHDCECYDYTCSPEGGGAGCPRGFAPCPKCGGHVGRVWRSPPNHEHKWGKPQDVPGVGLVEFCENDWCPDMMRASNS